VLSPTSLRATVPNGAVSGPITVQNAGGPTTSVDVFGMLAKVNSFAPASGVAGTQVTLTGTGMSGATAVWFNGVEASSIAAVTATSLKATIPPGATTGPIIVTTPGGDGPASGNFTIPLAITGISPTSGAPNDTVEITGTGFPPNLPSVPGGVKFGDATASIVDVTSTLITVLVPAGATDGPIVVGNGTVSTRSAVPFDVIGWPVSPPVSAPASPRKMADSASTKVVPPQSFANPERCRLTTRAFVRA
jgi:hypothetical protein